MYVLANMRLPSMYQTRLVTTYPVMLQVEGLRKDCRQVETRVGSHQARYVGVMRSLGTNGCSVLSLS